VRQPRGRQLCTPGVATTADHIWIARNRGRFIPITRVVSTQPVLSEVALRAESVAQTAYPATMAPAPFFVQAQAETMQGTPQQPQFNWTPMQGAY
jgi:hypothetical protein